MGKAVRERLSELERWKVRFGPDGARKKRMLLRAMRHAAVLDPADLVGFHETLCFLRAFPDDPVIMEAAEGELRRFTARVESCRKAHGGSLPDELVDSGIAGTVYRYPYGIAMVSWLVSTFGDAADIDWEAYGERKEDDLAIILSLLAGWVETAALDDEQLSAHDWFKRARGRRRIGALRWIVERLRSAGFPPQVQEALYDPLNITARWELGASPASRTLARIPEKAPFFQTEPLQGRTRDLRAEIGRPLRRLRPVTRARGRTWIDLARCALSVRERELYPLALANEQEVYEVAVGRGVRIVLFGMRGERRLPIESNYAGFVVRNGIPIGYAIGALLLDQVEIAVNIFPTFRQGESSFVFEQFARLFHHQFGSRVFLVERYQFGHENDEGLDAGSFWFYYKLGFRPVDRKVASLGRKEAARLQRDPSRRTSRRMLKRLARSNGILHLDAERQGRGEEISLTRIGLRVSRFVEERFGGDRQRAERVCAAEVLRTLGIPDLPRWSESERTAFQRLSPLVRILPRLSALKPAEKQDLARVLRAKGSLREARYARLAGRNEALRRALTLLSRREV